MLPIAETLGASVYHFFTTGADATDMVAPLLKPNAWMNCFEDDEFDVSEINKEILEKIKTMEMVYDIIREEDDKKIVGAQNLINQPFMSPHTPKEKGRRIFIVCHDKEKRIQFIQFMNAICEICKDLYHQACKGIKVKWLPGTFPPPIPPTANAIGLP